MNRLLLTLALSFCSVSFAFGDLSLPELIRKIKPSVCKLITKVGGAEIGTGSGFIVGEQVVVTNCHVIEGGDTVEVIFNDGTKLPSQGTLYYDAKRDVAILRVKNLPEDLPSVTLRAEHPDQGETVIAIGNPMGVNNAVTQGIVSAIRDAEELDEQFSMQDAHAGTWVQTDAAISGGNSGGPLVDLNGAVVGMCTQTAVGAQNLNYAISASDIKSCLKRSKDKLVAKFDPEQTIIIMPKPVKHDHLLVLGEFGGHWKIQVKNQVANGISLTLSGIAKVTVDAENATATITVVYKKILINDQVGQFSQKLGGRPKFNRLDGEEFPERIRRFRNFADNFFDGENEEDLVIAFDKKTDFYKRTATNGNGKKSIHQYFYAPEQKRLLPVDPRFPFYYDLGMKDKWGFHAAFPGYSFLATKNKHKR